MQADRIKENCTISGTAAIALTGAIAGYRAFSSEYSNGNIMTYVAFNLSDNTWEIGHGTYNSSGNIISRTTVLRSTNSNSLVSFGSGTIIVFNDICAEDFGTIAASGLIPVALATGVLDFSWLPIGVPHVDTVAFTYFN